MGWLEAFGTLRRFFRDIYKIFCRPGYSPPRLTLVLLLGENFLSFPPHPRVDQATWRISRLVTGSESEVLGQGHWWHYRDFSGTVLDGTSDTQSVTGDVRDMATYVNTANDRAHH